MTFAFPFYHPLEPILCIKTLPKGSSMQCRKSICVNFKSVYRQNISSWSFPNALYICHVLFSTGLCNLISVFTEEHYYRRTQTHKHLLLLAYLEYCCRRDFFRAFFSAAMNRKIFQTTNFEFENKKKRKPMSKSNCVRLR